MQRGSIFDANYGPKWVKFPCKSTTISWSISADEQAIIGTGRDVTREREQAEALMKAEEALRQSQKMEAVGQLNGGLAHDFDNFLTGIAGSLEMAMTRVAQGRVLETDKYLVAAQTTAKRAAALTHRLLAFSRRQTLDPKPTNLNNLIKGMEELIRRTVGPAVTLDSVFGSGNWPVLVDPNQLENALLNLCINARDAMPGGGNITIETSNRRFDERSAQEQQIVPGQYVSMCVSDNGVGMSADIIARAFEPFFTTKLIGLGTGLGLSMIYGFARQSGGHVRIYSEVGSGTMVCLYLPRFHGDMELYEGGIGSKVTTPDIKDTDFHILVVDDGPS